MLGALGLLAGVSIGSWLLGQCWDPQWMGEGQRTGSGDAGRDWQVLKAGRTSIFCIYSKQIANGGGPGVPEAGLGLYIKKTVLGVSVWAQWV